jgi:hypothetical protein
MATMSLTLCKHSDVGGLVRRSLLGAAKNLGEEIASHCRATPERQPYSSTSNTRVKDRPEDHLHELVCRGNLQLAIAEEAIASNWIAPNKTYDNADKPGQTPFTNLSGEGIYRAQAEALLQTAVDINGKVDIL